MNNKNKKYAEIKTGVIGVGNMGRHHAKILNQLTNLRGVSDVNEEQGLKISNQYSTKYFRNYEDLIEEVDFVAVAVPTFLHFEIGEKVMAAGKHLIIEKPIAKSLQESNLLIEKSREYNSFLSVGHIERFNDTTIFAKSKLSEGVWGKPISFSAVRYSPFPNQISDVGVLFDLTIHDVDIISYLAASKAIQVFASGNRIKHKDYEDNISLIIVYENGCRGICQTSWLSPIKIRKLEVSTETNLVLLDHMSKEVEVFKKNPELNCTSKRETLGTTNSLENELIGSLERIKTGKGMVVSGEEAVEAIKIVEAAHSSMLSGKVINL